MATGKEIKMVYNAMKRICIETSNLISVVSDTFEKQSFKPLYGSKVMWDMSRSYLAPKMWLPYFQQRLFIKNRGNKSRGIGINILFDDEEFDNKIPVISCGLLVAKKDKLVTPNNDLYFAGWDSEKFTDGKITYKFLYKTEFEDTSIYEYIINYFIPLDKITGQTAVKELIIEPLILMYNNDFSRAEKMIAKDALTIKDIKNEF